MIDLSGETVIVTGAGGGIGAAVCSAVLRAGGRVVAQTRRRPLPDSFTAAQDRLTSIALDLREETAARRLLDAASTTVRGLVHAAASQAFDADDGLGTMLETNVVAAHHLGEAVAASMATAGGGSIVHVSSIEARHPGPDHGDYATSKAALEGLVRGAAQRHGAAGVRVNAVAPGLIERPGIVQDWPDGVARWRAAAPLGRMGQPHEVAGVCLFLVSEMSSFVTGTVITADGGASTSSVF